MQQRLFHLPFYKGSSSRLLYKILCWGSIVGVQLHKFWGWMLSSYISKWGDFHCSRCGLSSSARRYDSHRCCNIFAVFFFSYTLMQTGFSMNQKCYLKEFWWMLHNPQCRVTQSLQERCIESFCFNFLRHLETMFHCPQEILCWSLLV